MSRRVAIVPHTHWDREWYLPFQTFRLRLVELLDELLPRLDADAGYAHFLLDGQMAVVDDYLAIRPHAADTLRRLATSGRVAMGPWYILMDEFLVSGETIIRNLELGLERAAEFGGAMEIGYLPDMFGHIAQMPQLLRQFGFEHAVVWRGVPRAIDRTGFHWIALDGSAVRAEYLPTGYGNGAMIADDADALIARVAGWEAEHADQLGTGPILWMNGSDHLMPQRHLAGVVDDANRGDGQRFEFVVTSLADHLAHADNTDLPTWTGELRSGARANLLMGVASNRSDVRRAVARAERAIERLAEPLYALHVPASHWPARELTEAWGLMIRNSAHDSICACSHDDVVDAVLHRYAEARHIADGLTTRALGALGASVDHDGWLVVNPSAFPRSGVVAVPTRDIEMSVRPLFTLPARQALAVFGELVSWSPGMGAVEMSRTPDAIELTVVMNTDAEQQNRSQLTARLADLVDGDDEVVVRAVVCERAIAPKLHFVREVAGYGWRPATGDDHPPPVEVHGHTMSNGTVTVVVEANGFSINGHGGLGRLVDDGDDGDTYNYSPPTLDTVIEGPESATVTVASDDPLRGALRVDAIYRWPTRIVEGRRVGDETIAVTTTLTLDAGASFVSVEHHLDNRSQDHRLRAWFAMPEPATHSSAECAFAVVERGLDAEGGPTEEALATFPSRRFVRAGGLTIVHEGIPEYELVDRRDDRAHTLALTLLRATRWLSNGPMTNRPLPAGPIVELHASQMPGRQQMRYAVHIGTDDPFRLVDDALLPLQITWAASLGSRPSSGSALQIDGAVVSSVRRVGTTLQVRVFNPDRRTTEVHIANRHGWLVDLRGRPQHRFDGSFPLGPFAIATAILVE